MLPMCGTTNHPAPASLSIAQPLLPPAAPSSGRPFTITILDVGQGDAALVQTSGGTTLLIDAGPPGAGTRVILPLLAHLGITRLDATLASHYDIDHVGGMREVFDGPDALPNTADDLLPRTCWDRGDDPEDAQPALQRYLERRTPCHRAVTAGQSIAMDDRTTLEILAVNGVYANGATVAIDPEDENAHSIAARLRYGDFRYLTMGDLPGGGGDPPYTTVDLETPLIPLLAPIDVLHLSHHGSQTATGDPLLAITQPEAVVISVGDANPYGHPHRKVLARLARRGVPIYLTEHGDNPLPETATVMQGPIVITTSGEGFAVEAK